MENCYKDKYAYANRREEEFVRQKGECDPVCSDQ
jgi:hypothetical protein